MDVNDICDVASEAGVVASIVLNPEFVFYAEQLTPHHFTNEANAYMYFAISELAKKDIRKIDAYNITNMLNARDCTKAKANSLLPISAINEFIENAPIIARKTPEEYKMLAGNIMSAAFRRDTYSKLAECQNLCRNYKEADIEQKIYSALDNVMLEYAASSDVPQYKDVVDDIWEEIKERQHGQTEAIDFPFPELNKYVVMEPGEVICFTAAAKGGKSAMLLTCTVDLLRKDKSVLYIDSEISTKLFTLRLLSHLTKIKFGVLRSGTYTPEEEQLINDAVEWMKTRKFIHVYLPQFDENTIYLMAKKAKHLINIDCIVVDYLKSDSSSDEAYATYSSLGRIADTLKNKIAGDMKICGLTAAQATATGKIADSARIARSVSTVVSIVDKTIEDIEESGIDYGTRKMTVKLNRNGAQMTENEWIDMDFDGSTVCYSQAKKQHEDVSPF